MKVLVTGGAGYIGSHAVRALVAAGHQVSIYDDFSTGHREFCAGIPTVEGDIADQKLLKEALAGADAVMHFAASAYVGESMQNPRKYFRNNVESALKLLDAILASDTRLIIFSSSCAVYGVPERLPILESCGKHPVNPYGATKLFLEHVLAAYEHAHQLKHVCLRYFNAAGAHRDGSIGEYHDPETHLIPLAMKAALGTGPALQIFGKDHATQDGTCVRDFIHVSDLAAAHVSALEYLAVGGACVTLNLGTGKGTSIKSLFDAIQRVTGHRVPHVFVERRMGDPAELYADPTLTKEVLGWAPRFDLTDILESAWQWETQGLPSLTHPAYAHIPDEAPSLHSAAVSLPIA